MKVLVVNCSAQHYNLGAAKLADWHRLQGHEVSTFNGDPGILCYGFDRICLSVVFSWHATIARDVANRHKADTEIWCGGPGIYALGKSGWWERETGLDCTLGVDGRFDKQRGSYAMTFASRGCPVGCWFCIVPLVEGSTFTLDWDFRPAPVLCDNNLSALPDDFQDHIIVRYAAEGIALKDANSGFEPRYFTEETYRRWKPVLRGPWRFAFDTADEGPAVKQMMSILADESARRKQVYCLVGNEPIGACHERAQRIIEWGGEPYCQPLIPLNALTKRPSVRHDWTEQKLGDFARFYNRHLWRSMRLSDYLPRQNEPCPFATLGIRKHYPLQVIGG